MQNLHGTVSALEQLAVTARHWPLAVASSLTTQTLWARLLQMFNLGTRQLPVTNA